MRAWVLLLIAGLASPDVVHLRNGGKIEGQVVDRGDKYEIETPSGKVAVAKEDVARIEKKEFALPKTPLPRKTGAKLGAPYSHPFYAFKIYLPPKWQRGRDQGTVQVSFWGPKDVAYQPRIDLRIEKTQRELSEFIAAYKDAFRKNFKDVQFLFEEASAVKGKTAYQFSVIFGEGEPPIPQQALFTFVADGERMFVLSFNCSQAWFERYFGMVDASMKSLRIYPIPAATPEEKQQFLNLYNRSEGLYREGKLVEALEGFEEAARLLPGFSDVHATVGMIRLKLGKLAESEAAYKQALQIDPDDQTNYYNLGVCLLRESKYDAAIVALKRATELDPQMEPALTNLGAAYLGKDLNGPAREVLDRAVREDPENPVAHYNLGLALERLDRKHDAEREYKEALKLDPRHEDARRALDRLKGQK
jgi:tetratricopeptide (TPR) repeat protein